MMASEFYDRTGIDVVGKPYDIIEELYYDFDGNKDDFCKAFRANKNDLITKTFRQINELLHDLVDNYEKELKKKNQEIDLLKNNYKKLKEDYDRDLEWKNKGILSSMSDSEYQELLSCSVNNYSFDKLINLISKECGFRADRIKIVESMVDYEVDRFGRLRAKGWKKRSPVYFASDYNYICFTIIDSGMTYEYVNGTLRIFEGEEYCE